MWHPQVEDNSQPATSENLLFVFANIFAVLWLNPESSRIEQFAKTSIRNTKTRVENARLFPDFTHLAQNLFLWTVWDWSVVCGPLSVVTRIANLNGPLTTDKILIAKDRVDDNQSNRTLAINGVRFATAKMKDNGASNRISQFRLISSKTYSARSADWRANS